ncbi:MAG: hypothetical protein ACT4P1_11340 [Sporichthyaceae bacterium]
MSLGWHPIDPGPGPRSPLLDRPPGPGQSNLELAHRQWRAAVEADEARLLQAHLGGPAWFPVPLPANANVVPVYGGTTEAIEQVVTTLVLSGLESGLGHCRVVNLSGWNLSETLRKQMRAAKRNRAQFEEVSARGSTVNLFGNPRSDELVALLVDALRISADRSAGRQTQQERQELERVVRLLRGQVTLDRIVEAVDVALGAGGRLAGLTVDEMRDLQDYYASSVSQRRTSQDRLSDLHMDLEALRGFSQAPGRAPELVGGGTATSIRWYDVAPGRSTDEVELGRQLLARAVMQTFTAGGTSELLVVVGAERLAAEVRDELVNAAHRGRKCLVLMYTEIDDAGARLLGNAGSSLALFLKMPNIRDATLASEHLGREYKFVVNGISIAEGQTQDWSNSYGTSSSRGSSTTRTSGRSNSYGGGAFSFSRSVGTSVSRSFEQGTSINQSRGGSTSNTATTSAGRVHEYVVEPEVLQRMPDDLMLIVGDDSVTIASCRNSLRRSPQTSTLHVVTP